MAAQQAVVADPDKTFWRNMHPEAADEFHTVQGQFLPFLAIGIVPDPECHSIFIRPQNPVVADYDPIRVAFQVFYNGLCTDKGFPDILQQFLEFIPVPISGSFSFTLQFPVIVPFLQSGQELSAEEPFHYFSRKKETIVFPSPVMLPVQSSPGRQHMDVRMVGKTGTHAGY